MKITIIALFALFTTGYSAMFGIELPDSIFANGFTDKKGGVTGGSVATQDEGAAAGGVEGEGATIGAAQPGSALFFGLGGSNADTDGADTGALGGFNLGSLPLFGGPSPTM